MKMPTLSARQAPLASLLLFALGCGVVEHAHEVPQVDTSDDFGPPGGTQPPAVGGAGVGGGSNTSGGNNTGGGSNPGGNSAGGSGGPTGGNSAGGSNPAGGSSNPGGSGSGVVTGGAPSAGGQAGSAGTPGTAGAPPLSGVTIQLGDAVVPKERAVAFIHFGHSNMAGYGTSPSSSAAFHFQDTHPRAFEYRAGTPPTLALEPTARTTTQRLAGPGVSLLKEALAVAKSDYYFISLGYGQNSAYCSQFLPGGLYYDGLIAAAKAIKGRVTFGAIFIYLGITERHGTAADLDGFPTCINKLVTAVRTDVGEPNLPVLMNDYEVEGSGEFAATGAVATAIRPQIAKIPATVTNSALVSCQGLGMQDDHHFNLDGQRTWAQRAIMTMQQKGWFPWK
jgi:Carbohydrate esterase, sialic acid-specific acetylesterase